MSRIPRLLPLTAIAIGGVLAINAVARGPDLMSAAKAFAEDVASPKDGKKPAVAPDASVKAAAATVKPAPVCAPTASELAKEAGLSPAELQVLQSLGDRRGQLDQREQDLDTQVQLMAAAEAKLDARIKEMNGLKTDIQGLLGQADDQQLAETGRLIRVYEAMPPKDAAGRMALMDDSVRLPIAAKMKERILAAVLAKMDPTDAKSLTEKLARRVGSAQAVANARSAVSPTPAPATPATAAAATPAPAPTQQASQTPDAAGATAPPAPKPAAKPHRVAKAKPHPKAPAVAKTAAATPAPTPAKPQQTAAAAKPAVPPAASVATPPAAGAPAAKSG
jgi:flagellar motility protein MotE (MotC chaperone)